MNLFRFVNKSISFVAGTSRRMSITAPSLGAFFLPCSLFTLGLFFRCGYSHLGIII